MAAVNLFSRSISDTAVLSSRITESDKAMEAKKKIMERMSTLDSESQSDSSEEETIDIDNAGAKKNEEKTDEGSGSSLRGIRRISIVEAKSKANITIKEGYLLKQTHTFGRMVRRFCTVDHHKLFLRKSEDDKLREEILLKDATVVENSAQNVNHGFTVMTPHHSITLAAYSRKELDEWMASVRQAALKAGSASFLESSQHLDGQHSWFACSHPRPTYCNVCGDTLNGVAWHGLSCEVCKFKSHRRCVFNVSQSCKWTTKANIEKDENCTLPNLTIPHQWMEGNLPTGSKCMVCTKACGSVMRLQDFRCLWCKQTAHADCRDLVGRECSLGPQSSFILLPSAVKRSDQLNGMWEPYKLSNCSPILAFVNSKSGDNKGVRFVRRLKYWLNPLQVFDLAISGPEPGLQLFQRLDQFRVLVFGGDGSVGWVLSAIDKLHLHSKCILGVVPLGTGNDLARVLGWGAQCSDEDKIPTLLSEVENSRVQLLDRWSLGFTKDTNFDVTCLIKKTHHRSPSSASNSDRTISPLTPPVQHSLSITNSVSNSSLSLSPEPFQNHLSPPGQDSISVNSSVSSCGYHTALSRTPSNGSISEKETEETKEDSNDEEDEEDKLEVAAEIEEFSRPATDPVTLIVTPPQDGPKESLKWAESLQNSIAPYLTTILLSGNDEQVVVSSQVLCKVGKQFINSLQDQQRMKLSSNQYKEDPLMKKCTILNEKLESLIKTLEEEIASSTTTSTEANRPTQKTEKVFQPRKTIMARANSLKKAVENILDTTEKVIDDQSLKTAEVKAFTSGLSSSLPKKSEWNNPCPSDPTRETPKKRASPLLSSETALDTHGCLPSDMRELVCMNNYFGLGLDAKITYEFHHRREENPAQYKTRARNMLLYGYLGGREFFTNTQRYLERKLTLECDGKAIQLPQRLQGLVFLNIPSYMAGTNFWGTEKEKEGFSAPSMDDKLLEVVGITGFTHLATTKVLGIQNQRLAQCRYAKIVVHTEMPLQVDGEARMLEPGTITVTHKNKARVIVKDKSFSQSLELWSSKSRHGNSGGVALPVTTLLLDVLTEQEVSCYREMSHAVMALMDCVQSESEVNIDVSRDLMPHVTTARICLERVFPLATTVSETADLEHLQDMESSVKSLIQETLWFLNMDKISSERESEMRSLVILLEARVKEVILAQHSTKTIAHRSRRTVSDSAVTVHESARIPSPHRERATQIGNSKITASCKVAMSTIGRDIKVWDNEDVCYWLKAIELEEYEENFKKNNVTGETLLNLKTDNMEILGISKLGHQTRFKQCLKVLKRSKE